MKEFFNKIKDFYDHNENGKMIFFFGFYLLFFIFLFILIATHRNPDYLLQGTQNNDSKPLLNSDNIMRQNYMFDYKVTMDDVLYDYYGKRMRMVDRFKYNNLDYYHDDESFFVDEGTWIKTENPILFYEFFQEKNIYQLLKQVTYSTTTSYDDGRKDYSFFLSSNTISDILYGENTDYDEIPNLMIVSTDKDNSIDKIVYQLNSYCQIIDNCLNTLTIEVTYDLFGSINKIDNPLE